MKLPISIYFSTVKLDTWIDLAHSLLQGNHSTANQSVKPKKSFAALRTSLLRMIELFRETIQEIQRNDYKDPEVPQHYGQNCLEAF